MLEMIRVFFSELFYYLLFPIRLMLQPDRWSRGFTRFTRVSFPVGVALIVALFLVACVVSFYIATRVLAPNKLYDLPWWRGAPVVALLVILIPIVTYYCVKLWLEGDWSAFEDIDRAWKAGLAELTRNGLDLRKIPIFVAHGTESPESEANLFAATGLSLTVANFPPGPSALHWYANRDGIYILCSDVGCLSMLAGLAAKIELGPTVKRVAPQANPAGIRATIWPSEMEVAPEPEPQPSTSAAASFNRNDDIRATMYIAPEGEPRTPQQAQNRSPSGKNQLVIDRREVDRQRRRLEHLCRLIRRVRRPLCPVNGMITVLPLNLLLADDEEGTSTKEASRVDVDTIVKTLKLRCPVTAVVTGWEAETGFHELIRRLEPQVPDAARRERFGKGFEVWAPPAPEEIGALCKQACFAFEQWVYQMFKDRDALRKPGNRNLYALLCRVRLYLEQRLDRILVGAYAHESTNAEAVEPLLFTGCYFVAAGAAEDRQAFVRSVINKLPDQQEELEWTRTALRDDQRCRRLAWAGWTVVIGLLIAEAAMLYWK